MLKQPITYTDYNGETVTENFYFNLTKAELFKMEVTADGNSLQDHLKKVAESNNGQMIIDTFESILKQAYGVRSVDGKRFMKSPQLWEEFTQTAAYSEFFFAISTDAEKASAFINGIVPADLNSKATAEDAMKQALAAKGGFNKAAEPTAKVVATPEVEYKGDSVVDGYTVAAETDPSQMSRDELEAHIRKMNGQ